MVLQQRSSPARELADRGESSLAVVTAPTLSGTRPPPTAIDTRRALLKQRRLEHAVQLAAVQVESLVARVAASVARAEAAREAAVVDAIAAIRADAQRQVALIGQQAEQYAEELRAYVATSVRAIDVSARLADVAGGAGVPLEERAASDTASSLAPAPFERTAAALRAMLALRRARVVALQSLATTGSEQGPVCQT